MNTKKCIASFMLLTLLLWTNAWAGEETGVESQVLIQTSKSWDGEMLPDYPEGTPEIKVLRITVPPGTTLPLHKHPVINVGVLLKGELKVVTEEDETLILQSGEAIVEVGDKWHYGVNEADEPAEIIVFYAGTSDKPVTVEK